MGDHDGHEGLSQINLEHLPEGFHAAKKHIVNLPAPPPERLPRTLALLDAHQHSSVLLALPRCSSWQASASS